MQGKEKEWQEDLPTKGQERKKRQL